MTKPNWAPIAGTPAAAGTTLVAKKTKRPTRGPVDNLATLAAAAADVALATGPACWDRMTVKAAVALTGTPLGHAGKMPCATYGISALKCKTGGKLAKVAGSICSTCYANPELSATYAYPSVIAGHAKRLAAILADPFAWAQGMAELITREANAYFRWHDSGDVQSLEHLRAIAWVAEATPHVRHWLPTKEFGTVRRYLTIFGRFPANLTVRLSAPMIGEALPESLRALGLQWSVAHYHGEALPDAEHGAESCHAYENPQGSGCGDCRACWDAPRPVSYPVHVAGRKVKSPEAEAAAAAAQSELFAEVA